jgi:hypothetical protein
VIRLLVKCTQQYDTAMVTQSSDRRYQEFPTMAAMAGGVHSEPSPQNTQRTSDKGGPWVPASTSYPERRSGWHGPSNEEPPPRREHREWAPRDQGLPDITALVPGTSGVICDACGAGGHFVKECTWITRMLLPQRRAHLASWMQAYEKGEEYFKTACTLVRQHGFMGSWTEDDCRRFALDIAQRAKRNAEDGNRVDYEARKRRYGQEKSPPAVGRSFDNRPSWKTHPSSGSR